MKIYLSRSHLTYQASLAIILPCECSLNIPTKDDILVYFNPTEFFAPEMQSLSSLFMCIAKEQRASNIILDEIDIWLDDLKAWYAGMYSSLLQEKLSLCEHLKWVMPGRIACLHRDLMGSHECVDTIIEKALVQYLMILGRYIYRMVSYFDILSADDIQCALVFIHEQLITCQILVNETLVRDILFAHYLSGAPHEDLRRAVRTLRRDLARMNQSTNGCKDTLFMFMLDSAQSNYYQSYGAYIAYDGLISSVIANYLSRQNESIECYIGREKLALDQWIPRLETLGIPRENTVYFLEKLSDVFYEQL